MLKTNDIWPLNVNLSGPLIAQLLLLISVLILLAGCESELNAGREERLTLTDPCAWVEPIIMDLEDDLTHSTAEQILIHNESWERFCD
jgi:hypothetical protein